MWIFKFSFLAIKVWKIWLYRFGGAKKGLDQYGPAGAAKKADNDDDFDLFGSDDEEEVVNSLEDFLFSFSNVLKISVVISFLENCTSKLDLHTLSNDNNI